MQGFYQRAADNPLAPPPLCDDQLGYYDLDEIQQVYTNIGQAERKMALLVEGIHCAACVWLIEHHLKQLTGILSARVNLTGRKLIIEWDNQQIQLSQILHSLADIGYLATPYHEDQATKSLKKQHRLLLYRMAVAAFAMMNLFWISIALYAGADEGKYQLLFHWVGLLLATPTLIYSGWPFYQGAWRGIKNRQLSMDLPIAIGASISWLYSAWITISQSAGAVYFDTVVNFLFVILLGRYLESIFKTHAVSATQRLLDLQPKMATLVEEHQEQIVAIQSIKKGQFIRVKSGENIPVDGVVKEGTSHIDESMLSGESKSVAKTRGDLVYAGTINQQGSLLIEVQKTMQQTALGQIIGLVEEAQTSKAPIQCTADKIVPWFVGLTLLFATITFFYWLSVDFEKALMAATAVLIITCPCAFGLATPMSIAVASGLGARQGLLIKNGAVLESLAHIQQIVFDKTGTLTLGQPKINAIFNDQVFCHNMKKINTVFIPLIQQMNALEIHSEHAIARAIKDLAIPYPLNKALVIKDFISQSGYGIKGEIEQQIILIGNQKWLKKHQIQCLNKHLEIIKEIEQNGASPIHVAINGHEVAILAIQDPLRDDAQDCLKKLQQQQIKLTLLTGDKLSVAQQTAQKLTDKIQVIAEVLPQDKLQVIKDLQQQGTVAMVGDGVNDAAALVQADIGIALGSGTDVSIASADIVLMKQSLKQVNQVILLARQTLQTIRQNIGISITYNIIMVPLAMMAMVTPLIAAIAMPISSLLVITNAARINRVFKH